MNSNRDFKVALLQVANSVGTCAVHNALTFGNNYPLRLRDSFLGKTCSLDLRGWVIIIQSEKMTENCTSLINAGPRLNADFK